MINDNCKLHLCLCQIEKERERWLSQVNLMTVFTSPVHAHCQSAKSRFAF